MINMNQTIIRRKRHVMFLERPPVCGCRHEDRGQSRGKKCPETVARQFGLTRSGEDGHIDALVLIEVPPNFPKLAVQSVVEGVDGLGSIKNYVGD